MATERGLEDTVSYEELERLWNNLIGIPLADFLKEYEGTRQTLDNYVRDHDLPQTATVGGWLRPTARHLHKYVTARRWKAYQSWLEEGHDLTYGPDAWFTATANPKPCLITLPGKSQSFDTIKALARHLSDIASDWHIAE